MEDNKNEQQKKQKQAIALEYDPEDIAPRVVATGGGHIYGYDIVNKKYVINENERKIIAEVFERYANGEPASAIAANLTERSLYRPNGIPFAKKFIYYIIHNIRYTGIVEHKGVVYDKIFPRIISDELWQRVHAITEENKLNPSRKKEIYDYILTGKLVCGQCHHKMSGESGTSHTGDIHYYYICGGKRKKSVLCKTKSVLKHFIEDSVIYKTNEMLEKQGNIRQIAEKILAAHKKATSDNTTLKSLMKMRAEAYKASQNIIKAIEQGIITEMTKTRLAELEAQMSKLDFEIAREKQKTYSFLTLEQIELYLNKHIMKDTESIKARKLLVNTFIREVLLYPNKIVITYNIIDPVEPVKVTKEKTEEIERQCKSAFLLDSGSCNDLSSAGRQ